MLYSLISTVIRIGEPLEGVHQEYYTQDVQNKLPTIILVQAIELGFAVVSRLVSGRE